MNKISWNKNTITLFFITLLVIIYLIISVISMLFVTEKHETYTCRGSKYLLQICSKNKED